MGASSREVTMPEMHIADMPAQLVAVVRRTVPMAELPGFYSDALGAVAGAVVVLERPGGMAAVTVHEGSYDTVTETYRALEAWLRDRQLDAGDHNWEGTWPTRRPHPDPRRGRPGSSGRSPSEVVPAAAGRRCARLRVGGPPEMLTGCRCPPVT